MECLVGKTGDYSPKDFRSSIDRLWKVYEEQQDDPELVKGLAPRPSTTAASGSHPSLQPISNPELASVITASLKMKDKALVEAAMTVDPRKLNDAAYSDLGATLHDFGLSYLHEEGMNHIVTCIPRLYGRYEP